MGVKSLNCSIRGASRRLDISEQCVFSRCTSAFIGPVVLRLGATSSEANEIQVDDLTFAFRVHPSLIIRHRRFRLRFSARTRVERRSVAKITFIGTSSFGAQCVSEHEGHVDRFCSGALWQMKLDQNASSFRPVATCRATYEYATATVGQGAQVLSQNVEYREILAGLNNLHQN
ncbi:hypothetical protein DOTSEDRAFT_75131 [Dothistroma septosporum NZE10]|uniref:Uncharacterized protein n=1 Tax=Dothistroma septosporum (strain NZE10 / CBS 128990) TaxID=675120 RepID=M2Y1X3_DOTSN|nr:hypothetical protein DOTSEDRAFT_75131 [Dothistroma septosporum NZE10]